MHRFGEPNLSINPREYVSCQIKQPRRFFGSNPGPNCFRSSHTTISSTSPRGDSFDCCTERYEIAVLLPNSELTKGNNKRDGSFTTEDHGGRSL